MAIISVRWPYLLAIEKNYFLNANFIVCLWCGHVAEVFLTAYQAIAFNGHLEDGNAILIHAVSTCVYGELCTL